MLFQRVYIYLIFYFITMIRQNACINDRFYSFFSPRCLCLFVNNKIWKHEAIRVLFSFSFTTRWQRCNYFFDKKHKCFSLRLQSWKSTGKQCQKKVILCGESWSWMEFGRCTCHQSKCRWEKNVRRICTSGSQRTFLELLALNTLYINANGELDVQIVLLVRSETSTRF